LDDVARGDRRVGVGHAGDAGEAAEGGGADAGLDRLLVLLPRLAEVDVHVEPAGRDRLAARVVDADAVLGLDAVGDAGDAAVPDEQVGAARLAGLGVEERAVLNEEVGRHRAGASGQSSGAAPTCGAAPEGTTDRREASTDSP